MGIMIRKDALRKSSQDIIYYGIGTRFLVFLKGILIAAVLGACYSTDIYFVSFAASLIFVNILGEGLTTSLIPVLQNIDRTRGLEGRVDYTNNIINLSILGSIILIALGTYLSPWIMRVLAPGFKGDELLKSIELLKIGLFIIPFTLIRTICSGYLQSDHKFKAGARSGIANNIVYILYLLLIGDRFGLEGLIIAGIIGVIAQIGVMINAMSKIGYRYRLILNIKDRYINKVINILIPVILSIGVNEINGAVDNAIGSIFNPGTISQLNYANDIISLILGLFILGLITPVYPILSETYYHDNIQEFEATVRYSMKLIFRIVIPISIILLVLSEPIISIFYERGAFGTKETLETAQILKYYAIGLVGMSVSILLTRVYYAINDTKTPIVLAVIGLGLNIILDLIFSKYMGGKGLALGTSLSMIIAVIVGIYDLNRTLGFLVNKNTLIRALKIILGGGLMIISAFLIFSSLNNILDNNFSNNILIVLSSGIISYSIYSISLNIMKI